MLLRLMTFNIAHGRGPGLYQGFTSVRQLRRNMERIAGMLRDAQVDIAALQEIDEESHWHRGVRLMDTLCENCDYAYTMIGVNTRREGRKPLSYGNALMSRLPVELWDNQPFGTATLGEKGFLYAEIELAPGVLLPIVNLHLDFRSRERRIVQIERLIEYLRARPQREGRRHIQPIVCGDFNSGSGKAGDAVAHLFRYLIETDKYQLFPEKARTFPAYWPRRGLDFVFVPRTIAVQRALVLPTTLSDHRPVVVEVEIPGVEKLQAAANA